MGTVALRQKIKLVMGVLLLSGDVYDADALWGFIEKLYAVWKNLQGGNGGNNMQLIQICTGGFVN